ncbi:RimK/LysX family protein [Nanoarchaeota archaeon]
MKEKILIGLTNEVTVIGNNRKKRLMGRIDSGATMSSMDIKIAADLKLGPIIGTKKVKSASGNGIRPIIQIEVVLKGKKFYKRFSLADRSHMKYKVLIGQNILKGGFIIDPSR